MLFEIEKTFKDVEPPIEIKKLILLTKKLLPDMVFNMARLEGNPFTYPEVQTLLDGITIGGHKLSDEQQVLRIKEGWNLLFQKAKDGNLSLTKDLFNEFNGVIAKDEALLAGEFRTGQVRIGGSDYVPPKAEELELVFNTDLPKIIERCKTNTDLAFQIFLWGALNQFYYDGNKRTSRLVANCILLSAGQGILNVKVKDRLTFNTLMLEFYNTKKADNIVEFFYSNCLER